MRFVVGAWLLVTLTLLACSKGQAAPQGNNGTPARSEQSKAVRLAGNFKDGDLIFHESMSRQSEMVRVLTRSRWTHMGVIFNEASGPVVLEAVSPVQETPLRKWIARGRNGHYVVKRLRDSDIHLRPDVIARMRKVAARFIGKPYDLQFRWGNEALYCSELAHKLFTEGADIRLGKVETAADMNLDDARVQRALRHRFSKARFNPSEPVITPDSIFNDPQLVEIQP